MSRKILLADDSKTLKQIVSTMILANVNDVKMIMANSFAETDQLLAKEIIHVVLFSWELGPDRWPEFIKNLKQQRGGVKPVFILMVGMEEGEDAIKAARDVGISHFLTMPCSAPELVETINHACNPVSLRRDKRYNVPDTTAKLEHGGNSFESEVINISKGGLLCEFECDDNYNWQMPMMITVRFKLGEEIATTIGMMGKISLIKVVESCEALTPKRIRAAYCFENPPDIALEVLEKAFRVAEEQEKLLDA